MAVFCNKQAIIGAMYVISPVDIIPEGAVLLFHSTSFELFSIKWISHLISVHSFTRCNWFAG